MNQNANKPILNSFYEQLLFESENALALPTVYSYLFYDLKLTCDSTLSLFVPKWICFYIHES